jgi:hypothetical protein
MSRSQHGKSPTAIIPVFWTGAGHEAELTLFQTHYYSENLVAQGIKSGTSVSVARNSDHRGGLIPQSKTHMKQNCTGSVIAKNIDVQMIWTILNRNMEIIL